MRTLAPVLLAAATACGSVHSSSDAGGSETDAAVRDAGPDAAVAPSFTIRTPELLLEDFQEIIYCYYFQTPNEVELAITSWRSEAPAHVLDLQLYLSLDDLEPPDTFVANCSWPDSNSLSEVAWVYSAHEPEAELRFPADDGDGLPVAQRIEANQPAYLRMHYFNPGEEDVTVAPVELGAEALVPGTEYTRTDPVMTYETNIEIPASSQGSSTTTCDDVTGDVRYFWMTTLSRRRSIRTTIADGDAVVFESTDFAHPGSSVWTEQPFHTFQSDSFVVTCDYDNPDPYVVTSGGSATTDETCSALMYQFPSTGPHLCYSGIAAPIDYESSR